MARELLAFAVMAATRPTGSLTTRAPFHLEATVRVLQRRPTNLVDVWHRGRYLRAIATDRGVVVAEVLNTGTIDEPELRCTLSPDDAGPDCRAGVVATLRRMLGLDIDPAPVLQRLEATPELRLTATALRGMRSPRFSGLFETLASVVPFQQLSLDAGMSIVCRLVETFGRRLDHDGRALYTFPSAASFARAPLPKIRATGLSERKAWSLRLIARQIVDGELGESELQSLPTAAAIRRLQELPGIGPWSAGLVLLRGLGRLDVFPPGDVGASAGVRKLFRMAPGASLERVIEEFGDLRGYLYFCSLGSSLLSKNLIQRAPEAGDRGGSR